MAAPRRMHLDLETVVMAAAVFATGFLSPSLGAGFAIADLFIVALIVLWLPALGRGEPVGVLRAVAVPILLILLGSTLGTMTVGVHGWIVRDTLKDLGALASFLAMVTILRRSGPKAHRVVAIALAAATIIVSVWCLTAGTLRAQAGFPNPNVAGHFLATNLILLARAPIGRRLRITTATLCVAGVVATGSFGALIMLTGGFAYLVATAPRRRPSPRLRRVLPIAIVAGLLLAMANLPTTTSETGFNTKHFARSSEGRLVRWTDAVGVAAEHPLGIGPGSNRGLGLLPRQQEAHNEYLAYLTERGLIGLAGLLLLFVALWRLGRRGGLSRALLIGFAIQNLVRETSHYRHLWLVLAFAIVLDEVAQCAEQTDSGAVPALAST